MSRLRDALQTIFRMVPWPTEPGLRASGRPDEWSPVLVTGNYDLTVRRLLRALEGVDAWVVVAPARGINVWCAASGGHLTTHQVVTALETSGVADRVRHRRALLPQLAATGVIAGEIRRRCGWIATFGPVYAEDIPRFLAQGQRKSEDMRRVHFAVGERLEMALAWGGPMAPLAGFALAPALAVFLAFDRIPGPRRLLLGVAAVLVAASGAWLGGACVVQCPEDALAFEDASGRRVEPELVRRFELNLLGQRRVDWGPPAGEAGAAPA